MSQSISFPITDEEKQVIIMVKKITEKGNMDNISRTHYYESYYKRNSEIKWAFLAGMVSRNAGWCMVDLSVPPFSLLIKEKTRKKLFMTYEASNWLIFSDAWPQLAIYETSKVKKKSLFHLLKCFSVSDFMIEEWQKFWISGDQERLMTSLIINEQHVIQKPVIKNSKFKRSVFSTMIFRMQDMMHFSTVVFPTLDGRLFGFSAYDFTRLTERIKLGKKLAGLLFHPEYHHLFEAFSNRTFHTGSRHDYEQFFQKRRVRDKPFLRAVYPIITHYIDYGQTDWFHGQRLNHFFKRVHIHEPFEVSSWYKHKQNQLKLISLLKEFKKA
ncbi:DUF2515 family protein [Metabacillus sp. RGM 3146]|uniref:DUF2515 family protein n=1 Tax=Metabacillus sp. RGM 3146 TaxID=3401092 RepID=UPI003B993777